MINVMRNLEARHLSPAIAEDILGLDSRPCDALNEVNGNFGYPNKTTRSPISDGLLTEKPAT